MTGVAMPAFPQQGGCLCGAVRYVLREDPVLVYACHCTDCQTETGSAFYLAVVVSARALEHVGKAPETWRIDLDDGRVKGGYVCARCHTHIGGPSRFPNLTSIDGGTFDDTSWIVPAAHIWTRSAQPWICLPPDALGFAEAPGQEATLSMVRRWKERNR